MKKKVITVSIVVYILTILFSETVFAFTQATYLGHSNGNNIICEPKADDIRYQYKSINGIHYRRLYNFTTHKPLSDWERF